MEKKNTRPVFLILNFKDPNDPEAGGAEKYCHEIALNSVNDGFQVIWISKRHMKAQNVPDDPNITFENVGGRFSFYLLYFFKLVRYKPSAMLLSVNSIPFIFMPIRIKNRVVHIHHVIPYSVIKEKLGLLSPIAYFMQRYVLPLKYKESIVSTNGAGVKTELEKLGFRNVVQIRTIVSGDFNSNRLSSNVIIAPGALRPWKGPADIIKAFARSGTGGKLILFGRPDSQRVLDHLNSLIEEYGLIDRVSILINITDDQKSELYKTARLAVVASPKEGVGLSALEPQAYACPVVAYDVPGVNECIINDFNGILVRYGDIGQLSAAIRMLYTDDTLRDRMSKACVELSSAYDSKTAYSELKDLLFKTLEFRIKN